MVGILMCFDMPFTSMLFTFLHNMLLKFIEFDQADERKLTKCLAKCTSKAKGDPKTNPISKIMTAINEKFPKLSDPILRLVMKKPEMLCR